MTPAAVSFRVLGLPAPQGSKSRMPNGAIVEGRSSAQRDKHRNWRSAVAEAAADHAPADGPLDGALYLDVTFRFPMPKGRPKVDRERGWCWKVSAPDRDKVLRSLCDGLEAGGLIANDARIVAGDTYKIEVAGWTGAQVEVGHVAEPGDGWMEVWA